MFSASFIANPQVFTVKSATKWDDPHVVGVNRISTGLTTKSVKVFRDEEGQITSLTRDGEMSLTVLPLTADGCLIDGQRIEDIPERGLAEMLNLNSVPAPASWAKFLHGYQIDSEGAFAGCYQLVLAQTNEGLWQSLDGKFRYSKEFGLGKNQAGKTPPE
jgi:CRISPR-associated endonuclease/helicase Cas3